MKRLANSMTILAAAVAAVAGAASAQGMKAEIPFAFQVNNVRMPAGVYRVSELNAIGSHDFVLQTNDAKKAVIALSAGGASPTTKDAKAKLVFQCNSENENCSLAQIWPGTHGSYYQMAQRGTRRVKEASLTVIPLQRGKGE